MMKAPLRPGTRPVDAAHLHLLTYDPLPMFRCPGNARTTTAPAGSSLIT